MSSSLYYLWSWLTIKVYYLQPKIWFEVYFELILNPGWLWNKLSTILGSRYANFWEIRRQFEWWNTHKRELKQTRRRRQRGHHLKNVTFLQSFLNYWKSLYEQIFYELSWIKFAPALQRWDDKIENLSSCAHVVHATAKQVISRRGRNENVCEMSKNEECTCKRAKLLFFIVKYANLRRSCCRRLRGCLSFLMKQNGDRLPSATLKRLCLTSLLCPRCRHFIHKL